MKKIIFKILLYIILNILNIKFILWAFGQITVYR